ncbi:DUF2258 domain-containing protein [Desulfurococcus mucosus]|uniref:Uncharacterized conserved protein UCP037214 n=1 Tax=Desulfurococcus mucosus (strain ATCC 35584 / DSM 2162 / JCM 9187 / O7/1) TaxID=765177 RepID=E8RAI1_DESM0|nr:DUF2258 domain-containing protein [Desulfurococcus mucosus]ADV64391.1 Uncharacterized conserved protein UCP037214 [Desulfurococcus mucosus DSM 2162]
MSEKTSGELNTGIIIAGAYAGKVRRTLYAQLSSRVKTDKEFAREVARASGELNMLLYHILVGELKVNKGDAVRVRVKYVVEGEPGRIKWLYDSLRLEVFKRVPDEEVEGAVNKVIAEKLREIQEQYKEAPSREEAEKILSGEEAGETGLEAVKPGGDPLDSVGSLDVIGETVEGGYLLKITGKDGSSMGVVTLAPSGEDVALDAILLGDGDKVYRYLARVRGRVDQYIEAPGKIIEELRKAKPSQLNREDAAKLIEEKMKLLI